MYHTITSQIVALGASVTKLPPIAMPGRKYVMVQNVGNVMVYIGNSLSTADTANTGGFQVLPRSYWRDNYSSAVDVWGIIATGSTNVLVEQGK